jgi:hypothetical protein
MHGHDAKSRDEPTPSHGLASEPEMRRSYQSARSFEIWAVFSTHPPRLRKGAPRGPLDGAVDNIRRGLIPICGPLKLADGGMRPTVARGVEHS